MIDQIRVTKTRVHKGRIAPQGCIFYVASLKLKAGEFAFCQSVILGTLSAVKEVELNILLRKVLMENVKNKFKINE